ncbi:CFEM domain-containing protein [Rhodotorula paludigena]|uniref:CFEM domain-containing protein n=1 Tax=Rhodotorula paludigena TaxID=86838 RepID=UPI00317FC8EC
MRPYTVIAAAFALAPTIALAQSINVPTCVVTCIGTAASSTSCASSDLQCLCSSSTFLDDVTSCMVDQCSQDDLTAGLSVGEQYCAAAGVSVSLSVPGAASTAAAETSSADTSAEPTAVSSTSSRAATESAASTAKCENFGDVISSTGSAPTASATPDNGAGVTLLSRGAGAAALIAAGAALAL